LHSDFVPKNSNFLHFQYRFITGIAYGIGQQAGGNAALRRGESTADLFEGIAANSSHKNSVIAKNVFNAELMVK